MFTFKSKNFDAVAVYRHDFDLFMFVTYENLTSYRSNDKTTQKHFSSGIYASEGDQMYSWFFKKAINVLKKKYLNSNIYFPNDYTIFVKKCFPIQTKRKKCSHFCDNSELNYKIVCRYPKIICRFQSEIRKVNVFQRTLMCFLCLRHIFSYSSSYRPYTICIEWFGWTIT